MPRDPWSRKAHRRKALLLALMCALPLPAVADTLYKCVDAAGITSIQMAPCAKGTKQVWARDSAPEPPPTPEQAAAAQARAEAQELARAQEQARVLADEQARLEAEKIAKEKAAVPAAPASPGGSSTPDPCDVAKDFAAQVRAKPWLGLDPGQMQRLYGWVAQECGAPKAE
ncbi:MAG: hypothetical protein ACREO3_11195 [Arenimonas sp.]